MISIIIPAYNIERYINETLGSVLAQTYGDFEVIVVSDGSTDATDEIVRGYSDQDDRVKIIRQEHQDAGTARNTGLDAAQGEYLLFFDADDLMEPDMLERMIGRALETDADITVCRALIFSDQGVDKKVDFGPFYVDYNEVYSGQDLGEHLFDAMVGWPWDKLYRSRFIRDSNLRFQSITSTNDALFVFLSLAKATRIAFIDAQLVRHRRHNGSIAATRHKAPHNARMAYEAIVQAMESLENLTPEMRNAYLRWGIGHMRWNFVTLEGEARTEAFKDYWELIGQSLAHDGLVLNPRDEAVRQAFRSMPSLPEQLVVDQAFELYAMQAQVKNLQAEIEGLRGSVHDLEQIIEQIEQSKTYKIGRVATKIPRMLRNTGNSG